MLHLGAVFSRVRFTSWQVPSCLPDPWVHLTADERGLKALARIVDRSLEYFYQFVSHSLKLWYQMHKCGGPQCNYDSGAHCLAGNSFLKSPFSHVKMPFLLSYDAFPFLYFKPVSLC